MARQIINIGIVDNDGTGDAPRPAGAKINENFDELYGELEGIITRLVALEGGVSAPVNVTAPVLSGTAAVGQVLSATTGPWTGAGIMYTRQWLRGNTAISGANGATYTLVVGDAGSVITCDVTATNSAGSVTVRSNASGVVQTAPPVQPPAGNGIIILADSFATAPATNAAVAVSSNPALGNYPQLLKNANPTIPIWLVAQGSRSLGTTANRDDGGNTQWGHFAEIKAATGSDYIIQASPNDGNLTAAAYDTAMTAFVTALRNETGRKVHITTLAPATTAYAGNTTGAYNAWRDSINTLIYQRAVLFDSIIPTGSHPTFGTNAAPGGISTDGLHPAPAGQTAYSDVLTACIVPMISGSDLTAPLSGDWFGANITASAASAPFARVWTVTNMRPGYVAAASISGGGTIKIGAGAAGVAAINVRNGDVLTREGNASTTGGATIAFSTAIGGSSDILPVTTAAGGVGAVTTFSPTVKQANAVLTEDNRRLSGSTGAYSTARSTTSITGVRKAFVSFTVLSTGSKIRLGLCVPSFDCTVNTSNYPGDPTHVNDGMTVLDGKLIVGGGADGARHFFADYAVAGDVIDYAIDMGTTATKVYIRKNDVWMNSSNTFDGATQLPVGDPEAGIGGFLLPFVATELFLVASCQVAGDSVKINAGQEAFAYPRPASFLVWG